MPRNSWVNGHHEVTPNHRDRCHIIDDEVVHAEHIGNANAILPMTAAASAWAYPLSTLVELGPNLEVDPTSGTIYYPVYGI
jgi:hypothetical protein